MSGRDVASAGKIRSLGNYAVDGVSLGKGTFSRVERATHVILKRRVALKIQNKEKITNQGGWRRGGDSGDSQRNITEFETTANYEDVPIYQLASKTSQNVH